MSTHSPLNPKEHPAREALEDFVLGELHVCRRVVVEAHLAFCESCRLRLSTLSAPAAALLHEEPAVATPDALWSRLVGQLDAEAAPADILAATPLPDGARSELPLRAKPLNWGPYGDASVALIAGDPAENMGLFLARTPPESVFPYHAHLGSEEIVILEGGYTDDFGHLAVGDFRLYGTGTAHAPIMDAGVTCWAVILVVGGLQFDG